MDKELLRKQAEKKWEANSAIREEFGGDKEAWILYSVAEKLGKVRISGQPVRNVRV